MNFSRQWLAAIALLPWVLAISDVAAESISEKQAQQPIPSASNFLGLGAGAFPKISGSSELRVMVLPVVQYSWGNRAYISGLKAGVWGYTSEDRSLRIGLYAEPRFGYDASDSSRTAGMADRDFAVDAGPSLRWTTPAGVVNFDYGFDITGRNKGQVAQLQFIRPLVSEQAFRLNGLVSATWQNAAMNTYYWGMRASETFDGLPRNVGAGVGFSAGLSGLYRTGTDGAFFFGASVNRLSDAQANSLIAERRYTPVIYLGYGWRL
jgi:outer membrane protein